MNSLYLLLKKVIRLKRLIKFLVKATAALTAIPMPPSDDCDGTGAAAENAAASTTIAALPSLEGDPTPTGRLAPLARNRTPPLLDIDGRAAKMTTRQQRATAQRSQPHTSIGEHPQSGSNTEAPPNGPPSTTPHNVTTPPAGHAPRCFPRGTEHRHPARNKQNQQLWPAYHTMQN